MATMNEFKEFLAEKYEGRTHEVRKVDDNRLRRGVVFIRLESSTIPEHVILRDMLSSRGTNFSGAAKDCLLEYALLLRDALDDLDLTADEATAVVFALHESINSISRSTYHLLYALVGDYLRRNPLRDVRADFTGYLRKLDYLHTAALIDAARRYWLRTAKSEPVDDAFMDVGLISAVAANV
jgi:hypothetical protein